MTIDLLDTAALIERLKHALGEDTDSPEPVEAPADTVRALVLDDDTIDRKALVKSISRVDEVEQVVAVTRVEEARAAMDEDDFDVAFFDHNLPDGEGLSLLPIAIQSGLSVLMVTGAGNEHIAVTALNQGASDYLVKDVQGHYLELLPNALRRVIQHRRLQRERDLLIQRVDTALETIRLMRHLVSICAQCKKVRVTEHQWEPIETYLGRQGEQRFSHGYCPECYQKVLDENPIDD